MAIYGFWNNKGGTGKTSLCFQAICQYADLNPEFKILAIDMCPQANLSEMLLGGLSSGSSNLLKIQGAVPRATVGGYFQLRLPSPYSPPNFKAKDFVTVPAQYNQYIPDNVDLVCGDPMLELQANAINTLANTQIPGTDAWIGVIDWLSDFLKQISKEYDVIFIDANPSFSIYTQIALSCAERLVLPVMADDSSRRAIQNAFSLLYGLRLPSPIYASYAFHTRLTRADHRLPTVHVIARNRMTQYMGEASGYAAVLESIDADVTKLLVDEPSIFDFTDREKGMVSIRDFQTTGVVAFARGCPFFKVEPGRLEIMGKRIRVREDYIKNCVEAINGLVKML